MQISLDPPPHSNARFCMRLIRYAPQTDAIGHSSMWQHAKFLIDIPMRVLNDTWLCVAHTAAAFNYFIRRNSFIIHLFMCIICCGWCALAPGNRHLHRFRMPSVCGFCYIICQRKAQNHNDNNPPTHTHTGAIMEPFEITTWPISNKCKRSISLNTPHSWIEYIFTSQFHSY